MLLLACVLLQAQAQRYNVYVKNKQGVPLRGVLVYSFPTRVMGENAMKELREQYAISSKYKSDPELIGKTDAEGLCIVKGFSSGSILLDGGDVQPAHGVGLYRIKDFQKDNTDFSLHLVLDGIGGDGVDSVLREVEKTATLPMAAAGDGTADRHGNTVVITKELDIDGEYARGDGRFVAFPFIVFEQTGDTVYMPPSVIDGKDFGRSMMRRMSFDIERDKLEGYHHDRSMHMQDHLSERFLYAKPADIERGTKYHVPGILWYEDYNGVYHRDSVLFSDGKEREPMRFLEWSSVFDIAPIDRTAECYYRKGTFESVPDNASFNLDFEVNRTALNMADSATVVALDSMLRWLSGHYAEGAIQEIVIRGYSSPEGSESRNRELSRGRSETIRAMLARHFPGVYIRPYPDPVYHNIVPWPKVVDYVLTQMEDTVARANAMRVQQIVEGIASIDAQNTALKKHRELYDYMKENVLPRVRKVDIQANIIMQKVLSTEEVIALYEKNENGFREKMVPYQYYIMMCHLADEEKWEELRVVSKRAYERLAKESLAEKTIAIVTDTDTVTKSMEEFVPYPLAGYYYAMSTLRCGQSDPSILRPYLDDGGIGNRVKCPYMNALPFLVGQVLMYCQEGNFGVADQLIMKYGLSRFDNLEELIMFVRCLDGQYRDGYTHAAAIRKYVMESSPMNKAVMLTALGQYRESLALLYSDAMPENDAKVEYMKAICHFQLQPTRLRELSADGFAGAVMYAGAADDTQGGTDGEERNAQTRPDWAAPMLEAIRLDNTNLAYIENDGYFNNAYRQMVAYFCKRLKAGVPIGRVVAEYDALIAQMRENKSKMKKQ